MEAQCRRVCRTTTWWWRAARKAISGIIPGMTENAFAFKVISDAVELRQHIVRRMEQAEGTNDPEVRKHNLSFIVVGAGFSGVEVAGEVNELVRSSTRFYHNFKEEDVRVVLVHSEEQILPEVAPTLREFAREKRWRKRASRCC